VIHRLFLDVWLLVYASVFYVNNSIFDVLVLAAMQVVFFFFLVSWG
jgi:hypothetical protein